MILLTGSTPRPEPTESPPMLANATILDATTVRYELTGNCEPGIGVIELSGGECFPRYMRHDNKTYGWSSRFDKDGKTYVTYIR